MSPMMLSCAPQRFCFAWRMEIKGGTILELLMMASILLPLTIPFSYTMLELAGSSRFRLGRIFGNVYDLFLKLRFPPTVCCIMMNMHRPLSHVCSLLILSTIVCQSFVLLTAPFSLTMLKLLVCLALLFHAQHILGL